MWKTSLLTDRSRILAYLETDRRYAAYAIGDLEPGMFEQCTWAGAEKADRLQALILHFRGLQPPPLFLMGDAGGLRAILEQVPYPEQVYLNCRTEHLPAARDFYVWDKLIPMWRMMLPLARFQPVGGHCIRLGPAHSSQLTELFTLGGGIAFSPTQVEGGVFYGVFVKGQLVAAAGTHLTSPIYGVAAVGNIFAHPDFRGRGHGTATTSAVVAELLQSGIRDVVLNVGQDNVGAIRIYERLGFERHCPFLEGPASVREAASPQPTAP